MWIFDVRVGVGGIKLLLYICSCDHYLVQ
jgi:hypothetical protein